MTKEYYFIAYSCENFEKIMSDVINISPAIWLKEKNDEINSYINLRLKENEIKVRDLMEKWRNESIWQRLKDPLTKEGRENHLMFINPPRWKLEKEYPLIKLINWQKITKSRYYEFKNIINGYWNDKKYQNSK